VFKHCHCHFLLLTTVHWKVCGGGESQVNSWTVETIWRELPSLSSSPPNPDMEWIHLNYLFSSQPNWPRSELRQLRKSWGKLWVIINHFLWRSFAEQKKKLTERAHIIKFYYLKIWASYFLYWSSITLLKI
jgi:hypothetical protein